MVTSTPSSLKIRDAMRMSCASTIESGTPSDSNPNWLNWRKRPACGRSWRNIGPSYHSFTGCGRFSIPWLTYARATDAVASGRIATRSPDGSSNAYISFSITSVCLPSVR